MSLLTLIGIGVIVVLAALLLIPRNRTRRIGMGDGNPHRAPSPRAAPQPDPAPDGMDHDFGMRLYDLVANGRKVEALSELRQRMRMSEDEAKIFLDRLEAQHASAAQVSAPQPGGHPLAHLTAEQAAEIDMALDRGRKLEAIKHFREWSGVGLKEAKEAVEAYERRR